jgi:ankyrin repeat protein
MRRRKVVGLLLLLLVVVLVCSAWYMRGLAQREKLGKPLWEAAEAGNYVQVKKLLDRGADPNYCLIGVWDRLENWLDNYPQGELIDSTPLMEAVGQGQTGIVRLLIQRGANVNVRCIYSHEGEEVTYRRTPLQLASQAGYADIVLLLKQAGAKE